MDPFDTHSSELYRIVLNGESLSVRKCFLPGSEVYYKWDFVTALLCLLHDSKYYRAVVVAGGTMQPLGEFRDQLFLSAGGTAERLTEFSCGHVIPPENILPIALTAGPSGKQLDFAYQSRTVPVMVSLHAELKCVKCSKSICCS